MAVLANRVKTTVASAPSTGDIALGNAVQGYQSFSDGGIQDGDVVSYVIEDTQGTTQILAWEFGRGTYAAAGPSLARTTILGSSVGSLAPIDASASANVYIT